MVDEFELVQAELSDAFSEIRINEESVDMALELIDSLEYVIDCLDALSDKLMHIIDNI